MRFIKISFLFFLVLGISLTACKKDEPQVITIEDFTTTIPGCIANGQVLGTIKASASTGTPAYSISTQSITSALAIAANTGQLTIADKDSLYNAYNNGSRSMTVTVSVTNASVTQTKTFTITLDMRC